MEALKREGWKVYGGGPERFVMLRRRQRTRWYDTLTSEWVGPEHSNVAPAVAWALYGESGPIRPQEWSTFK